MTHTHTHVCASKNPAGFTQQKLFNPYAGHRLTQGSAHTRPSSFSLCEYAPFNLNFPDIKPFVGYRNLAIRAGRAAFAVCLAGEKLVADPQI